MRTIRKRKGKPPRQKKRRERKGGRPKGGGVIKTIDPTKQDSFEIRRRLHAGSEPVWDQHAQLFMHWRNLCLQSDDCARRLTAGEGDKWTRKRLKQLQREIDDKWCELGIALRAMSDTELSQKLAILSKAARPAVYGWQEEATRQIEYTHLLGDKPEWTPATGNPNRELIEQRKSEQGAMTAAQRAGRIHQRDAGTRAYEQFVDTSEGRAEQDSQKRLCDFYAKYPQHKPKKPTRKQRAEQARSQREHAAKFVPVPIPQTGKVLSLAGAERNNKGEIIRVIHGRVNLSARQLYDHLRKQGNTMTLHDVRRFVRDTLKVRLRSERGKRIDLKV